MYRFRPVSGTFGEDFAVSFAVKIRPPQNKLFRQADILRPHPITTTQFPRFSVSRRLSLPKPGKSALPILQSACHAFIAQELEPRAVYLSDKETGATVFYQASLNQIFATRGWAKALSQMLCSNAWLEAAISSA